MWAQFMPAALTVFSSMMSYTGNSKNADSFRSAGEQEVQAAEFQAEQLEVNAGQSIAAGQQAALEQRRQSTLVQSRIQALVAAGGGGSVDPSIVKLISNQAGEGAYRASLALYQGEDKARQLRIAATAKRYEGQLGQNAYNQKANASDTAAVGGLLQGAGSLFAKYGMGGSSKGSGSSGDYGGYDTGAIDIGGSTDSYLASFG